MIAAASRIAFDGEVSSMPEAMLTGRRKVSPSQPNHSNTFSDVHLGFGERAFSAAGAAFLSVILVNPLDVAKTRLQAQAATDPYSRSGHHVNGCMASLGPERMYSDLKCSPSCTRAGYFGAEMACTPECSRYKGTMDVFYKIIRQEGVGRLWRGTNANLALAIPTVGIYLPSYDILRNWIEAFTTKNSPSLTPYAPLVAGSVARSLACITCYPIELAKTRMQAFKETQTSVKPPGVRKTLHGVLSPVRNTNKSLKNCVGTQLARDVPYSAICWSTLEPIRRKILVMVGEEANAASILGANFSAGFIAGSLAAAATCPLDVVKTRRQIEKDPRKAMGMTTRQTLMEVWRDGGIKGLFMGVGPRVGRAGPSVGIVVSFYEVVKYVLYQRSETS